MGAPVSPQAEGYIIKAWSELKKMLPPDEYPLAKAVLRKAKETAQADGKDWIEFPKYRKTRYICSELEKSDKKRSESQRALDKPWSLSSLHDLEYDLPPAALPTVLRAWKWCVTTERPFTVRDAIWVARLYTTITGIEDLCSWASIYAQEERTAEIRGKPFDSSEIDPVLVMNQWERVTVVLIRELIKPLYEKSSYGRGMLSLWAKFGKDYDNPPYTLLYAPVRDREWPGPNIIKEIELKSLHPIHSDKYSKNEYKQEANLFAAYQMNYSNDFENELNEESKWVYVHWLHCLSEGHKWRHLTFTKRFAIIKQLREWIISNRFDFDINWFKFHRKEIGIDVFKPTDLLKEVGYEFSSKEVQNERPHHQEIQK